MAAEWYWNVGADEIGGNMSVDTFGDKGGSEPRWCEGGIAVEGEIENWDDAPRGENNSAPLCFHDGEDAMNIVIKTIWLAPSSIAWPIDLKMACLSMFCL